MRVHGLEARQGVTTFAFLVMRLERPVDRDALIELIGHVAAVIPAADAFLAELPEAVLAQPLQIIGLPWLPPESEGAVDAQRRLLESSRVRGVAEVWCFQTGTSLPRSDDDLADGGDDGPDAELAPGLRARWSHGPPPQVTSVRFPLDGYPQILADLEAEDVGVAFKLAGPPVEGESTVLLCFHSLWLSPYGGRHRHASVTVDSTHHAAYVWADRVAVPSSAAEQVHHLMWVLSKIDDVMPILHARFASATMEQKYGGLAGEEQDPFVLGGNPLLAIHRGGGAVAVDRWIAEQTDWSSEELAQMLRELAIAFVNDDDDDDDGVGDDDDDSEHGGMAPRADRFGAHAEDRSRYIARYAAELLEARAAAGLLDPRAAAALRRLLATSDLPESRRREVIGIVGALRDRAAVPALLRILENDPARGAFGGRGAPSLLTATATALGAIGDAQAIGALTALAVEPGPHYDAPRPAVADALASCLAAAPERREVDDAVLSALRSAVAACGDPDASVALQFAYGRLVRPLEPERRALARQRLEATPPARDDLLTTLARQVALVLAGSGSPAPATARALRPLVHEGLTGLGLDHESTLRTIRVVLRVAETLPELVEPEDLRWLTRFGEPDIRARAHALLAQLGTHLEPAPVITRRAARALSDLELARLIGEPHVVGRAALVRDAGRRALAAARPRIIEAVHGVLGRARPGGATLLEPEASLLAAAVPVLRDGPLDADVIALFDRMLRHPSCQVKWELLQDMPHDERLLGGMFHVLAADVGWQETKATRWLARFRGSAAFEVERARAGIAPLHADEDDAEDPGDDEAMN